MLARRASKMLLQCAGSLIDWVVQVFGVFLFEWRSPPSLAIREVLLSVLICNNSNKQDMQEEFTLAVYHRITR